MQKQIQLHSYEAFIFSLVNEHVPIFGERVQTMSNIQDQTEDDSYHLMFKQGKLYGQNILSKWSQMC